VNTSGARRGCAGVASCPCSSAGHHEGGRPVSVLKNNLNHDLPEKATERRRSCWTPSSSPKHKQRSGLASWEREEGSVARAQGDHNSWLGLCATRSGGNCASHLSQPAIWLFMLWASSCGLNSQHSAPVSI